MKLKIWLIGILLFLLILSTSFLVYILYFYENITQIVTNVTLSYNEPAPTNSKYYFNGQNNNIEFDSSLFKFDEIKDYSVKLSFKQKEYTVLFHIIDDVKPEITINNCQLDLYKNHDLKSCYKVNDISDVDIKINMENDDLTIGNHELIVQAIDKYGNTNELKKIIKVIDTRPQVNPYAEFFSDYDYENMSLDEIIEDYKKRKGFTNQIAISYYNFITGETYFNNPDQYMIAGSTYKLPLNMYIYEQINSHVLSPDDLFTYHNYDYEIAGPVGDYLYKPGDKIPIKTLQYYSIVYSDNTASRILFGGIGGWDAYRAAIKKYSNISYTSEFNENKFTVRYVNDVLKYLYQNSNNFSELLSRLKGVAPQLCLKKYVNVPIAQKDGLFEQARNVAGIVYASKPYATAIYVTVGEIGMTIQGEVNLLLYNYSQAH